MRTFWLTFTLHVEDPTAPLEPLQVPDVDGLGDPRLRDAVLAHAGPLGSPGYSSATTSPGPMENRTSSSTGRGHRGEDFHADL